MNKNLYELLGVKPTATVEEIKHAYRRQAMKWHPDRHTSDRAEAEERFKEIAYAYSILSDPFKRQEYDQSVNAQEGSAAGADFTDEMAFDAFLAAILDMAFELASRGHNEIQIYRLLVAGGCPAKVAETISHHVFVYTGQHPSNSANGAAGVNASPPTPPTKNPDNAGNFPWIRYFARSVDMTLFAMLGFFTVGWLKPELLAQQGVEWFLLIPILFVWAFVEAWFLSALGNTPGKWLLNIKVSLASGQAIDYETAFWRSLKIWWRGLGTGFPLISVVTMLVAYFRLVKQGATSWDEEGGYVVTHGKVGGFQWAVAIALLVAPMIVPVMIEKSFTGAGLEERPIPYYAPDNAPDNDITPLPSQPPQIHYDVMQKLYEAMNYNALLAEANRVLTQNPDDTSTMNYRGLALLGLGDVASARSVFLRTMNLNSNDPALLFNLSLTYAGVSEIPTAINLLQRAFLLDPNNRVISSRLDQLMAVSQQNNSNTIINGGREMNQETANAYLGLRDQHRPHPNKAEHQWQAPQRGCVFKPVMSDDEMRACGIKPPTQKTTQVQVIENPTVTQNEPSQSVTENLQGQSNNNKHDVTYARLECPVGTRQMGNECVDNHKPFWK